MTLKILAAISCLGMLLVLLFSAMSSHDMMSALGASMESKSDPVFRLPSLYWTGELGLILFGLAPALIGWTAWQRSGLAIACFLLAGLLVILGGLCVGWGTWSLRAEFAALAVPDAVIDIAAFNRNVASARLPILSGWILATIAAAGLAVGVAGGTQQTSSRPQFSIVGVVAIPAFLLLCISSAYGFLGYSTLTQALGEPGVLDASRIAGGAQAVLLARLATSFGLVCCGGVLLLAALIGGSRPNAAVQ